MENEYFCKISNISMSEKAKNRGLKHITFLFSEVNDFISTEMRYKLYFNGYDGISRSHKNFIIETFREVIPSY